MRLFFVLGTAAELIKIYPLIHYGKKRGIESFVLSTGQSDHNFWKQYEDFGLSKDHAATVVKGLGDLQNSAQAFKWFFKATMRSRLNEDIPWKITKDDYICVHGDTLSTVVGAKWGKRLGIPVVHIEAGMRSHNVWNPFPEELNRRYVAKVANFHMAPDETAAQNLKREKRKNITVTGANTVYDAVKLMSETQTEIPTKGPFVLANLHRFENLNSKSRWKIMVETLIKASQKHRVVLVMHPPTAHKLENDPDSKAKLIQAGVTLLPRQTFRVFIKMLHQCEYVISDGGSNQEECFYLGKPCLILREKTERVEGLGSTCLLSQFKSELIDIFLSNPESYRRPPWQPPRSPSEVILDTLGGPNEF